MKAYSIRDARETDRDSIRDVTLSAYDQYGTVMPSWAWKNYRESILATLANVKPAEQFVAEQDGAVVGTVLLFPAGTKIYGPADDPFVLPFPEVRLLAVKPTARGQGIGEALVQECIRRAQLAGAARVTLHTTDMMAVAKRMYERMGFVRDPERDFRPAENVIVYGYGMNFSGSPT